jgi:hypothetical protein
MKFHLLSVGVTAAVLFSVPVSTFAQQGSAGGVAANSAPAKAAPAKPTPKTADGHPDLSGTWAGAGGISSIFQSQKKEDGSISIKGGDQFYIFTSKRPTGTAARAYPQNAPSYKPEFVEKVKYLSDNESKTDQVFYCGKPGVPRIGPPRQIVQTKRNVIFLYEDMSGDSYRVIPIDGRPHRAGLDPSYNGDSIGHWEGNTLVVEVVNFVEDTWFGENGYFHSDAMKVTERLTRDGDAILYQVTVEDPKVLTAPFVMSPKKLDLTNEQLEESPRCSDQDGNRLLNSDHHQQR